MKTSNTLAGVTGRFGRAELACATVVLCVMAAANSCRKTSEPAPPLAPQRPASAPFVMDIPPRPPWELPETVMPQPAATPPRTEPVSNHAAADAAPASLPAKGADTAPTGREPLAHLLARADRALAQGQTDQAVTLLYQAADLDPTDLDVMKALAVALTAAGRFDEALPIHQMLAHLLPGERAPRYNLAMALARTRRFHEAQELLLELVKADSGDVRARYNLAAIYQAQGKFDLAAEAWNEVVAQGDKLEKPDLAAAYAAQAQTLSAKGDAQGAMSAASSAARLLPEDPATWLNFAVAAKDAGSYGRAIFATRRAADLAPMETDVWNRLGTLWLELHRATGQSDCLRQAVEAWEVSLRLKPGQTDIAELLKTYRNAAPTSRPPG